MTTKLQSYQVAYAKKLRNSGHREAARDWIRAVRSYQWPSEEQQLSEQATSTLLPGQPAKGFRTVGG